MNILKKPTQRFQGTPDELDELDEFFSNIDMELSTHDFSALKQSCSETSEGEEVDYGVHIEDLTLDDWLYSD